MVKNNKSLLKEKSFLVMVVKYSITIDTDKIGNTM